MINKPICKSDDKIIPYPGKVRMDAYSQDVWRIFHFLNEHMPKDRAPNRDDIWCAALSLGRL